MRVIIIIPVYNEEKNIEGVMQNLINNYSLFDYIIINDCSTDTTKQILEKNNYNHINLPVNLGIGGAVQTGYKFALENGYDVAVQMDGDGQHDPMFIESMVKEIEKNDADIVIGSRFIDYQGFQSTLLRRLGINFFSNLINLMAGIRIKDVTSGYRMVNKRFISIYAQNYAQDYPEPEAIVTAVMSKAKIIEYPMIMHARSEGESSISILKSMYYMIKVSIAIVICRLIPKEIKIYE